MKKGGGKKAEGVGESEQSPLANEVRTDFLGRKVIIAVARGKRPHEFAVVDKPRKVVPKEKCFFCPGNEKLTPPEIDRIESEPGKWLVRCFPNKFAATGRNYPKAYGAHEVIVDTPDHQKYISDLSEENINSVLHMIRRRVAAISKDKKMKTAIVFKNEGKEAGASLEHTHWQIIALDILPPLIKEESDAAKKGKCRFCEMKKKERKNTFINNGEVFAFCPTASRFHFESWIMPKRHVGDIRDLTEKELASVASAIKMIFVKLEKTLNYPPYNLVLHTSPFSGIRKCDFHFHIEILPKLSKWAGFEHASDVIINSLPPEQCAEEMRKK